MAVNNSGTSYLDSLLIGYSWTGNTGQTTVVDYNFNAANAASEIPSSMQGAFTSALQKWANVANVSFNLTTSSYADASTPGIFFGRIDLSPYSPNTIGITELYGFAAQDRITQAIVAIDDRFTNASTVVPGTMGYLTILHEIGHALGLEHPGAYGQGESAPHLPGGEDNIQNTILSYFNGPNVTQTGNPPITPMIYDIAAIQYLYGANTSYNSGASYYTINSATGVQTIWDGGGSGLLSANGVSTAALLDLREGINNYSKVGNAYTWIAFNADIEQAQGGSGADTIHGNDLSNILYGGNGNDTLNGYENADSIFGDAGADSISGGDGNDYIIGGTTQGDTINGGAGDDLVFSDIMDFNAAGGGADSITGGLGVDNLWGGSGNDTIYGDEGNDVLYLGGGADIGYGGIDIDVIVGMEDSDTIYGGDAYDFIYGDNYYSIFSDGGDLIYSEGGNDIVLGGGGNDSVYGGTGNDVFYLGTGNDLAYGDNDVDVIQGETGNDTLYGGAGNDLFYYAAADSGADTLADFAGAGVAGGDIIRIAVANMNGNGINTAADAAAAVTYGGGNAMLDLGGGITITIVGVIGPMVAGDFMVG